MFDLLKFKDNIAVVTDTHKSILYSDFNSMVDDFLVHFTHRALVFCMCENTLPSLVGYVACLQGNMPLVLLDSKKDEELIERLIDVYQPEYIWGPSSKYQKYGKNILFNNGEYGLIERDVVVDDMSMALNEDLCMCLTTSGSTGSPKFVRLSRKNLISNAESIAEYLGIDENERPITVLPMHYSFGMSVINSHLIKGATLLLTDKSVTQREFWNFLKEYKATSISGVPYTYEMLVRLRFFRMDIPSLKTMTQAGGKLSPSIVKDYAEYAEKTHKHFVVMYGQTEASPRMSYLPSDKCIEKYSSIGVPIPGGKFLIRDTSGNEIKEPYIDGELVFCGENVCMGYAEKRADLSKGDENNGILYTGDIAHCDENGFYYITGRMKRFVKIWGNRTNLDALETLIKENGIECACVGVDDRITVYVTDTDASETVRNLLIEKTGFNPRAFVVKAISVIPKNSSGKIQYRELQA